MSTNLSKSECTPCKEGDTPLKGDALAEIAQDLDNNWEVVDEHHLCRTYKFEDWQGAADFVSEVADLAEKENHHPDVTLSYGKVDIKLFTHKIGGLSENDFILAAKIEQLR